MKIPRELLSTNQWQDVESIVRFCAEIANRAMGEYTDDDGEYDIPDMKFLILSEFDLK